MKRKYLLLSLLVATAPSAVKAEMSRNNIIQGSASVYRVIDGDTFILNLSDTENYFLIKNSAKNTFDTKYFKDRYRSFRVRLANVNTAELGTNRGDVTAKYVRDLIGKKKVSYSCWDFGKKNRVICSISNEGKDLGSHLINKGYSDYITHFGTHPYLHKEYKKASGLVGLSGAEIIGSLKGLW